MAEQIIGPIPPDYHYERVVDGVTVETMPGTGVLPGGSGLATTSIDDTGNIVTPQIKRADPVAPPPPGELDQLSGQGGGGYDPASTDYNRTGGYSTRRTSYRGSGGYSSGGSSSGYSGGGYSGGGGGGGGFVNAPRYADGTTHPFFGGPPRIPGGQFAAQSQEQGQGYRTPAYVPSSGAFAGEGDVRAANPPESRYDGGGSSGAGGSGQGGGGGPSSLYYQVKDRLTGGGSSGGSYPTEQSYRRQQRRADRAYEQYSDELYNPDPLPVHGWAKQQGYKPGSIEAALGDPTMIIGDVIPGFHADNSIAGSTFSDIPMTDLALATFGTGKRGLTTKTPIVKVPQVLRQQGVKPTKPESKRMLDPSAVVNRMAGMYGDISAVDPNGGTWFDTDQLLQNLANTKKKSAVGMQINNAFEEDPASGVRIAGDIVRSVLSTMSGDAASQARLRSVDNAISNIGGDILRRNPKKGYRAISELAKQYLV